MIISVNFISVKKFTKSAHTNGYHAHSRFITDTQPHGTTMWKSKKPDHPSRVNNNIRCPWGVVIKTSYKLIHMHNNHLLCCLMKPPVLRKNLKKVVQLWKLEVRPARQLSFVYCLCWAFDKLFECIECIANNTLFGRYRHRNNFFLYSVEALNTHIHDIVKIEPAKWN